MVEIEWSTNSQKDLNEIIDYIAQDSLEFALTFYEEVKEKLKNLIDFPKMGRIVPELNNPNIRELIFRSYRLVYRILEDKIQVVRIIHGARILDI